jgi:hypothetical protein
MIFSGPAELQIPSPQVLRFLDRQVDFIAYEVAGFEESVLLLDYRSDQQNNSRIRPGSALTAVSSNFQQPSHLEIWEFSPTQLQIELHDTIRPQAPWIFSLVLTPGRIRPNHRAFFQRIASPANHGGTVMTLDRQFGKATATTAAASMPIAVPA